MSIAFATATTSGHRELLACGAKIDELLIGLGIVDDCSNGELKESRFTIFTAALVALTGGPVAGKVFPAIAIIEKSCQLVVYTKNDVTASSAVPAVGTAKLDVLFAPERDATLPPVA